MIRIMVMVLTVAFVAGMWRREKNRVLYIPASVKAAIRAIDFAPTSNLLSFPETTVHPGSPMPHWDIYLGDRYSQQAAWTQVDKGTIGFLLQSAKSDAEIRISAEPVHVAPGMRMRLQSYVKNDDDLIGNIAFAIVLIQQRDTVRTGIGLAPTSFETNLNFVVKEPTLRRRGGWSLAQQTITLPARSHSVIFEIRGKFQGSVRIRDVRLEIK